MKRLLVLATCLAAIILPAIATAGLFRRAAPCPAPSTPIVWDRASDEAAIRQVLTDQDAAWNRGDLDGFMAGYWRSPALSFYSGKDKTHGWQATMERYVKKYRSDGKEMGKLTFSELEVDVLSPDAAVVRGRWQLELSKEKPGGLYTLILKRFPEGWRIVHDHTSG